MSQQQNINEELSNEEFFQDLMGSTFRNEKVFEKESLDDNLGERDSQIPLDQAITAWLNS